MQYLIETYKCKLQISEEATTTLNSPEAAARIAREIFNDLDQDQEHFILIAMNGKNNITGFKTLFTGTQGQCTVGVREVFRAALILGAASIIWVHNHPTGDTAPSPEDHNIHKTLRGLGEQLNVRVLDGIILGHGKYWSFGSGVEVND